MIQDFLPFADVSKFQIVYNGEMKEIKSRKSSDLYSPYSKVVSYLYNYLVPRGALWNLYPRLFSTSRQTAYLFFKGIFPFWAIHNVQI